MGSCNLFPKFLPRKRVRRQATFSPRRSCNSQVSELAGGVDIRFRPKCKPEFLVDSQRPRFPAPGELFAHFHFWIHPAAIQDYIAAAILARIDSHVWKKIISSRYVGSTTHMVFCVEIVISKMVTFTPKDYCVNCKCVFEPTILDIERFIHSCTICRSHYVS